MSKYEKIAFVLSLCVLVIILAKLVDLWAISASLLLVMLSTLLYKLHLEGKIEEMEEKEKRRENILNKITEMVERIFGVVNNIRDDFRKSTFTLEQKLISQKEEIEKKMRKDYYDLADKIIDLENRLNRMRKILGTCVSYLEEKLKAEEEIYEDFSKD